MRSGVPPEAGALLALGVLLALAAPLRAQGARAAELRVESGVDPAAVTVGQPFRSALRLVAPAGYRVEYDELATGDSIQAVGPVEVRVTAAGAEVAVYDLVLWVTGPPPDAFVTVRVIGDGATTEHRIRLALPTVNPVLPAEGEAVEPRPVKGLVSRPAADGLPWWWLLLILAAIIAAILAYLRLRRGDESGEPIDAREWAFAQLDAIRERAPDTPEEVEEVYRRSSWVLRGYLARLDDRLGPDLATGEVEERMLEIGAEALQVRSLRGLLDAADRVKFAGHERTAADALAAVASAREWIETYPPVPPSQYGVPRRVA